MLDELAIYNRALTAQEIENLFFSCGISPEDLSLENWPDPNILSLVELVTQICNP